MVHVLRHASLNSNAWQCLLWLSWLHLVRKMAISSAHILGRQFHISEVLKRFAKDSVSAGALIKIWQSIVHRFIVSLLNLLLNDLIQVRFLQC